MSTISLVPFYGYSLFTHLMPLYAVYTIIINDTLHSTFQLSTLLAAWSGVVVLLEVPSGALADIWNKKHVAVIGQSSKVITCIIWSIADSYPLFLLGFIFWGIQESFCSGAVDALLYETVTRITPPEKYQRHYSRCYCLTTMAVVIAIFTGALLYRTHRETVFCLSITTSVIALFFTFAMPHRHPQKVSPFKGFSNYFITIVRALGQAYHTKNIMRLFYFSIFYITLIGTIEEFIPVYLQSFNCRPLFFGGGLTLIMLAQATGGWLAGFLPLSIHERPLYIWGIAGCSALALSILPDAVLSLIMLIVTFVIIGINEVGLNVRLNEVIHGQRATILSLQSLTMNGAAIIFSILIGTLAERFSLQNSFTICGTGALFVVSLLVLAVSNRPNVDKGKTSDYYNTGN